MLENKSNKQKTQLRE